MAVGEVQGRLNLIWNLVIGIMTAAGAIVLAWGIFEFAAARISTMIRAVERVP